MLIKILVNGQELQADFPLDKKSTQESFLVFLRKQLDSKGYVGTTAVFALKDFPKNNLDEPDEHFLEDFADYYTNIVATTTFRKPKQSNLVGHDLAPISDQAREDEGEDVNTVTTASDTAGAAPSSYHAVSVLLDDDRPGFAYQAGNTFSPTASGADEASTQLSDDGDNLGVSIPAASKPPQDQGADSGYESSDEDGGISPSHSDSDVTPTSRSEAKVEAAAEAQRQKPAAATIAAQPSLEPQAAPAQNASSTKKIALILNNIDYVPLPIAQPVFHKSITKEPVQAAIPLTPLLTEQLFEKLSELLPYCRVNKFGGLKQHTPAGMVIIKDLVGKRDKAALKAIGHEARTRREGVTNLLKEIFAIRDPFILAVYATLAKLENPTAKNIVNVINEISLLIQSQTAKLEAAGVSQDQQPSPKR